jgi:hypothetical protein
MPGVQRVKYKTNNGSVFNVILDASAGISVLIGTIPGDAYTENMTVRVSKNNKEVGIRPRQVLLSRVIGNEDVDDTCLLSYGYRYKTVPIPTKERWDAIEDNATFNISGTNYKVKKKISEKIE